MAAEPGVVQGPQIRLLQCFQCKTIEEIPDYPPDGNPQHDVVLHTVDEKHGGHTHNSHTRTLHRVPVAVWQDRAAKRQIVDGMWKDETGFRPSYYDVKNTLMEDAVKCHQAHHRQVPCIDYRIDAKRLRSPSQSDRDRLVRDLAGTGRNRFNLDAIKHGAPQKFLCDFCPVQSAVEYAQRKARGEA